MFGSGSPVLQSYAAQLLREIGKVINHVPNRISLSGHTDAAPFSTIPGAEYSNWELSADRANASRRALIAGGMDEAKVARVVGLSSAVLFDKQQPNNPVNRRISIIVLNKETEEAILHDEGKLEQTTAESNAASAAPTTPAPKAAEPPVPPPKPEPKPEPPPPPPAPVAPPVATPKPAPAAPATAPAPKPATPAKAPPAGGAITPIAPLVAPIAPPKP